MAECDDGGADAPCSTKICREALCCYVSPTNVAFLVEADESRGTYCQCDRLTAWCRVKFILFYFLFIYLFLFFSKKQKNFNYPGASLVVVERCCVWQSDLCQLQGRPADNNQRQGHPGVAVRLLSSVRGLVSGFLSSLAKRSIWHAIRERTRTANFMVCTQTRKWVVQFVNRHECMNDGMTRCTRISFIIFYYDEEGS